MQAASQFTPDQLIVAARRAEAQGQPAYALQFYRYVADHFPMTTEAYEARDALFRLAPSEPASQPPRQATGPATGYILPGQPAASPPTLGDVRPIAPEVPAKPIETRPRRRPAPEAAAHPSRGHRLGRFVAAMLNTIGWLLLISSLAAVPLMVMTATVTALPKALRDVVTGNLLVVGGATFAGMLIGLFAIFAAQVSRAAFDTADAVRALAAVKDGSG